MDEWNTLKKENYMKNICINLGNGIINFSQESFKDFNSADIKTYEEYLDIQWKSLGNSRRYLEMCYYEDVEYCFKGRVERVTDDNILFKRILINGMYIDGTGFEGVEDHVWMDRRGFENYKNGDCLSFCANIYRYIKKNNGKLLDYGLREASNIRLIHNYEVPTDEDLINQQIEQLVCETCLFTNNCFMGMCVANKEERQETIDFLKQIEPGSFTPLTVLAAYEIAGQVFSQMTNGELDKNSPKYQVMKKILNEAGRRNAGCVWRLEDAVPSMFHPQKPRIYIYATTK